MTSASPEDIRNWLDAALKSERGIMLGPILPGDATHLRQRIYMFRTEDRKISRDLYHTAHPMYRRSIYDGLTVEIKDGWLHIRKLKALSNLKIEEL